MHVISFPVAEVEPAQRPLPEHPWEETLNRYLLQPMQWIARREGKPEPRLVCYRQSGSAGAPTQGHSFVTALRYAFSGHRPFVISPDMIWLLIVQGFSRHTVENAEALRSRFVSFEGQINLDVEVELEKYKPDSPEFWEETIFPDFTGQIAGYVGQELADAVAARFSTTRAAEKAAFELGLMEAMSKYFTYSVTISCGIPEITLEGTLEDWELVERKTALLAQYDLEWWVNDLAPLLRQFTETAKGNIDRSH